MTISTPELPRRKRQRVSLSRQQVTGLIWQIVVVGIAVAAVAWLWSNALHNLLVRRISTGFAFLGREAGMPIADSWIAYSPKSPYLARLHRRRRQYAPRRCIGVVLATVLGTLIGIARLSSNWLLSRLSAVYVEVLRDVPLLLQLLFWYGADAGTSRGARRVEAGRGRLSFKSGAGAAVDSDRGGKSLGDRAAVRWPDCAVQLRRRLIARQMVDGRSATRGPTRWRWCWTSGAGVVANRRILDHHAAGAARLQLRRRLHAGAGIFRAAYRARDLHLGLHRRDRALRHPGGDTGANGRRRKALGLRRGRCCGTSCCRRRCASSFRR